MCLTKSGESGKDCKGQHNFPREILFLTFLLAETARLIGSPDPSVNKKAHTDADTN